MINSLYNSLFVVMLAVSQMIMPIATAEVYIQDSKITLQEAPETSKDVKEVLRYYSALYDIEYELMEGIVKCESDFIPRQSECTKKNGTRENSWGIWQINLDAHPEITIEQAMDVEWSTEWASKQLKKDPTIWTCYKNLINLKVVNRNLEFNKMSEETNIPVEGEEVEEKVEIKTENEVAEEEIEEIEE